MAALQDNLYDSLAEDARKLREIGKSWGLDDTDVDVCFQQALAAEKRPPKPRKSSACRCFGQCIFGVFVLVVAMYVMVGYHKPTKMFAMRHTQDFLYPLMRAVRLVSLPLRSVVDLSGLHEQECLVNNPFFAGYEQVECWPCEEIPEIRVFRRLNNFTRYYYHSAIPFVIKDANISQVTFDDLKSLYLDYAEQLSYTALNVKSNNDYIRSIGDLLIPTRTLGDFLGTDFHLQWHVQRAGGVSLIRNISPKPYFVPQKAEVASEMFVLIHTPASEAHPLPLPEQPNVWMTQAHGSQEVTFDPLSTCKENCTQLRIVLEQSDVLFYAPRYWELNAFSYGDDVSIAFVGSFF